MSVSSNSIKTSIITANGTQTDFTFAFKVFSNADVKVVVADAQGVETVKALTTDYTVTRNLNQDTSPGGHVIFNAAPTSGLKVLITGNHALTQGVRFSSYRPDVVERAFDKLTLLIQQYQEKLARTFTMPITSTQSPEQLGQDLADVAALLPLAQNAATAATQAESAAATATGAAATATGAATTASAAATSAANNANNAQSFSNNTVALYNALLDIYENRVQNIVCSQPAGTGDGVDYSLGRVIRVDVNGANRSLTTVFPHGDDVFLYYEILGGGANTDKTLLVHGYTHTVGAGVEILTFWYDATLNQYILQTENPTTGSGSGSGALYAADMTALRAIAKAGLTNGAQAVLEYHTDIKYGGGGVFVWKAASVATDDNGTIIASNDGGNGRWLRQISTPGRAHANWFGAKNSNSSADGATNKTAFERAAIYLALYTSGISGNSYPQLNVSAGSYYTDPIKHKTSDMQWACESSGVTKIIGTDGFDQPVVFITGGTYLDAIPYGGLKNVTFVGGNNTYPAVVYIEAAIDNQFRIDDIGIQGAATGNKICDGLSICNYLNMSIDQFRLDRITGYGFRVRRDTETGTSANTTYAGWGRYRWTVYNSTTGVITFQNQQSERIPGTAVILFTTGVLPTRTSTGVALKDAKSGTCYFMGNITDLGCTLHDTEADARAGINPILLDAATGSGTHQFAVFSASFPVTGINATADVITFTNDKNILICTSQSGGVKTTFTYGTGNTGTGTFSSTGGVHAVLPVSTGTLDSALTVGTWYYPIYIDAYNIKLASSVANAIAGTAINLAGDGTGTMTLIYDHHLGPLGVSGLKINKLTYDNQTAPTIQTTNGIARSGLGVMFIDLRDTQNKGPIEVEGHRVEINKAPAQDLIYAPNAQATMFRVEIGRVDYHTGTPPAIFSLNKMMFDGSTSIRGDNITLIGNAGNGDLCPSINLSGTFNVATLYANDRGTAFSKSAPVINGKATKIPSMRGFNGATTNIGRAEGTTFNSDAGMQSSILKASEFSSSMVKRGDLFKSWDIGTAYYQATQSTNAYTKGTGATNALGAGITVSATAGDKVFIMSAVPTEANFGNGSAVSIAGAGVAGATITGVVTNLNTHGTGPFTFVVNNETTGALIQCDTTISGVTVTYPAATVAKVPTLYSNSAALNFPSIAALASSDLTIAAPTGVTLTEGKSIRLGLPSNVPTGIVYTAFVTAGGASVTVRATNITAGAIDPASGTFSYEVSV